MAVDLHSHTTVSDGLLSPEELVARAVEAGLATLAITDHDAVDALAPARAAAPPGLEILAGVELSCRVGEREAHILGYGVDPDDPDLRASLARYARAREERARGMVERLVELGAPIEFAAVERLSGGGTIARPHVAAARVAAGHVATVDEAFKRWIGRHGPAFVDKPRVSPAEACELVRAAGGVAGLAHPGTFRRDDLIPILVEAGMEALEVRHTEHSAAVARHYEAMAVRMGLLPTGGSDFHGSPGHRSRLGIPAVPDAWVEALVARMGTPR
ncbi:MAG TPA: PHP domain-containing protein [Gemmatimonadota bacterium]|nr:PHP domain-containing protein [Gemmatimonadota bacterium]